MATKGKLGPAKTFGARYGRTVKHVWGAITSEQRKKHQCRFCKKITVRRVAMGIWACRSCGAKFAGKAYTPGGQ